jgi:DNA polymerase-3 subunit gamma/tau
MRVSLFADPADPAPAAAPATPYRVLARKYRPQRFADLLGQEAMVTTLGNAIRAGRVAQAYLLAGVRGVGKTSTARLIAKALNCVGPDGKGGMTIDPCGVCDPCRAIAEGRFIDVIELDAASNTGIDKMRELLDGVPYAPVAGRFKVYIIDEVHQLSTHSFNALLKTLEEPPPHVKFLFATTDVQKLPVTILSRCQRFDLRRIPADMLADHYGSVCRAEGVETDPEALAMIARAAEGSVRDGLSILDQAIAHAGGGSVTASLVADMLGLADRGRVRALMAAVLAGQPAAALQALRELDSLGADPLTVMDDLLDLTHAIAATQAGLAPAGRPAEEASDLSAWAQGLGPASVHRLWQLLLKGRGEVKEADRPLQAAEMALLRVTYAAGLPDPAELLGRPESGHEQASDGELVPAGPGAAGGRAEDPVASAPRDARAWRAQAAAAATPGPPRTEARVLPTAGSVGARPQAAGESPTQSAPDALPVDFAALVRLFEDRHESVLAAMLHDRVRPVRHAPPVIEIAPAGDLPRDFAQRVASCLGHWTGQRWTVVMAAAGNSPTLAELAEEALARLPEDPALRPLLAAFPGARILDYEPEAAAAPGAPDGEQLVDPDAAEEERA